MGKTARAAATVVVIGAAVLAVVFSSRFGRDPNLVDSPLVGQPAPDIELELIDGSGTASLSDLRGDIVVVNFFASWCLGCRREHADLVATADAFADEGITFVQIAYQDRPEDSIAFLNELGFGETTTYLNDEASLASIAFGVFGIPETYFIDRDGIVQGKIQGESNALLLGQTLDTMSRGEAPGTQIVGDVQSRPDE